MRVTEDAAGMGVVLQAGVLSAVTVWCEAVQGRKPLRPALRQLAESLGAGAIAVSRVNKRDEAVAPGLIAEIVGKIKKPRPLARSYARNVFGRYFGKTQIGTVWYASMNPESREALSSPFQRLMGFYELAVIPLEDSDRVVDCLEIHFPDRLDIDHQALLNMVASNLARTWQDRSNGLFTDVLLSSRKTATVDLSDAPLLSWKNTAHLSRMEFRVCVFLSRGYSLLHVREELGISDSTVRTHMRMIYSKTNTDGLPDLLYHLFARPPTEGRNVETTRALDELA